MTDTPWKPNRPVAAGFFFTSAAGLFYIIALNTLPSASSESAVWLGLSAERLALLGGMLILFAGLGWLGLQTLQGKTFGFTSVEPRGHRMDFILGATLLVFLSAWLLVWTPAERFGTLYYYIGRIYSFAVWLACVSAAGLVLLMANRFGLDARQFKVFLREQRIALSVAGAALLIFGFLALAIAFRVVNMSGYVEDFWYGAGVPLLPLQVLFAAAVSIGLVIITKRFFAAGIGVQKNSFQALSTDYADEVPVGYGADGKSKRFKNLRKSVKSVEKHWPDLILFLAIWAIAAWLWAQEPVNPDFFITKPIAPNFELYPDYDAKFFDLVSQYALIGQGLNNGIFYDRPLYSAILVYLHTFAGQDYSLIVALQAALFAIFPALGYLLGKRLHSRAAGAGLAILFTLRGMNAIETGAFINTAHQKQMMTDFPSAVLMLVMTVLLVRWLQEPGKNWPSLGLAAGVLGLATFLRPHPLIYLPVLIALVVWVYRQKSRIWITLSGLVLVAALAGILPWLLHNGQGRSIVDLYLQRVKDVIRTRYPDFRLPGDSLLPPLGELAAINNPALDFPRAALQKAEKSVLDFSIDNFLNNLTTSVQALPNTPYYQDLRYTVKDGENFWISYWDGSLSPWAKAMLPINLILLALGLGTAWKRARLSGLVPLLVMLAYFVMNALARTSGGRYLVPVDWVVIVYYFLGILMLIEIVGAFFRPNFFGPTSLPANHPPVILFNRPAWIKILSVVFLFIAIGSLVPLSGSFFEQRYPLLTRKELAQQFAAQVAGSQLGFSSVELNKFLSVSPAVIFQGRILYPREFEKDRGAEVSIYTFYHPKPYPRMLFTLLGPKGETRAIFPATQAAAIPNASDAIILGCRENDYIQVWAVFLTSSNTLVKRTPATPLTCPLVEPVCDNNHHCK